MASSRANSFVQLDRSFRELLVEGMTDDRPAIDLSGLLGKAFSWADLLKKPRVVLLSEAGAGKTFEIRAAAKRLVAEGKPAFFLRLENVANGLEDALEVGSAENFECWKRSEEEGWLFLDSVDESRLKSPRDFENAVRRVDKELGSAKYRTHLLLTSRVGAWRPVSDRRLCNEYLPVSQGTEERDEQSSDDASVKQKTTSPEEAGFKFFALEDLNKDQVRRFALAKGVSNLDSFLDAISNSGADALTARPLDLDLLIQKWNDDSRLGTLLDITKHGIDVRLKEWDPNREDAGNPDLKRIRAAVQLLAAAATLTRSQEIRVPDGVENTEGLPLDPLLIDMEPEHCKRLLQRPIFDEGNYGMVRFHHRSTREFLTAEWFFDLLQKGGSRRSVESYFFREVYGETIVSPVLRPILAWLSIWDEPVRRRVVEIAPEILLEGGDPSSLPLDTRIAALERLCDKMACGELSPWFRDFDRMAGIAQGLSHTVQTLFHRHTASEAVVVFLLRLVEQGKLLGAWSIVVSVVQSADQSIEAQKLAIHAANAIGSSEQLRQLRKWHAAAELEKSGELLAVYLEGLLSDQEAIEWLLGELKRSPPAKHHSFDALEYELPKFVDRVAESHLPVLVEGLEKLLEFPPLMHEPNVPTSQQYGWLMKSACQAMVRLLQFRHPFCFESSTLAILARVEDFHFNYDHEVTSLHPVLKPLVQGWPEMNRAVFWASVRVHREARKLQGQDALTSFRQLHPQVLWGFRAEDFIDVLGEIRNRDHADDRRVALSLALWLYDSAERPTEWLWKLREFVREDAELERQLEQHLAPQVESDAVRRLREMEEKHKRAEAERKLEKAKQLQEARDYFQTHLERLKGDVAEDPGHLSGEVINLLRICQSKESAHSRWSVSNWQSLEPEYGPDVARFFRDAVVSYWRHNSLQTRSEGVQKETYGHIIGLVGLAIESRENPAWMENLTSIEVDRACRFASFEMNDFPDWFPNLFERFPEEVGTFLLGQVRFEVESESPEESFNHIIQNLTHTTEEVREWLAPYLLDILEANDPNSTRTLDSLLRMVRASSVEDAVVAKVSARKWRIRTLPAEHRPAWLAAWVGADPANGIRVLAQELDRISEDAARTTFAQQFITRLVDARRRSGEDTAVARATFQNPRSLKALYDLMHHHIRVKDDIDRADGGVYSPELRDYAQEARDALFYLLEQIPGEEAYRTILEIADQTSPGHTRSWILQRARAKAEQEGNLDPWEPESVREFHESLLRTPRNLKELGELAVLKIWDLKDNLENSDYSIAGLLIPESVQETEVRNAIGEKLRDWAQGRYQIEQEGELADRTRPDLRFIGNGFDGRVPVELKLAERWRGPELTERLENQLCGDYLRDERSGYGIFLLVNRITDKKWRIGGQNLDFSGLVEALQEQWGEIQPEFPHIEKIEVVGIDLTKRDRNAQFPARLHVIVPAQAVPDRSSHQGARPAQQVSPHGVGSKQKLESTSNIGLRRAKRDTSKFKRAR